MFWDNLTENTQATLEIACREAVARNIRHLR